jgi:transcriptional regulator with XRE-family HTH domain
MSLLQRQRYLIGEDLIALRRKIGWSQQTTAEYLGLHDASQLNQIEDGRRWINHDEEVLLQQLEEAFHRGELQTIATALGLRKDPTWGRRCTSAEHDLPGAPVSEHSEHGGMGPHGGPTTPSYVLRGHRGPAARTAHDVSPPGSA